MQLLSLQIVTLLGMVRCPGVAAVGFRSLVRQPDPTDPGASSPTYPAKYNPCSCDCCLVAARQPADQVALSDGRLLTRKCVAPPPEYQTEVCTSTCTPSSSDVLLTASKNEMDYSRFCNYKCRPSGKTIGTICETLGSKEIQSVFNLDGNGNGDTSAFLPADGGLTPDPTWGGDNVAKVSASANNQNQAAKASEEAAKKVKEHVEYNMRKVISERYRSEAAANTARAASEEAWSKANRDRAKHAAEEAAKVQTAVDATSGAAGENEVAASTAAAAASTDAGDTARALITIRTQAVNAAKEAVAMAKDMIPPLVAAAAKQEGEANAFRFGWDKPPNWDKVIAVAMSEPYLKAMVGATWRASEYNSFARGVLGQAKAARSKAASLNRQANQYQAMGDNIQAKLLRHEVQGLIGQSAGLEASAQGYWNTANSAQNSIGEWQQAGNLAANHAGWAWHLTFTPAPEFAM